MAFIKEHRKGLAFIVLFITTLYGFHVVTEGVKQAAYDNQMSACDRGNILREVVYTLAEGAVIANLDEPGPALDTFREQKAKLETTPFIRPDGSIDCDAAIEAP